MNIMMTDPADRVQAFIFDNSLKSKSEIFVPPSSESQQEMAGKCKGCPYARHGLTCRDKDGSCIRTDMDQIYRRKKA